MERSITELKTALSLQVDGIQTIRLTLAEVKGWIGGAAAIGGLVGAIVAVVGKLVIR